MRYRRRLRNIYLPKPYKLRSPYWKYRRKGSGGSVGYRYREYPHFEQSSYPHTNALPRKEVVYRYEVSRRQAEELYKPEKHLTEFEQLSDEELTRFLKEHLDKKALRELIERIEMEFKESEPATEKLLAEDERESPEEASASTAEEILSNDAEKIINNPGDFQVEADEGEAKEDTGLLDKLDIEPLIDEIEQGYDEAEPTGDKEAEVPWDAGEVIEPLAETEEQAFDGIEQLEADDISCLETELFSETLEPQESLTEPVEPNEDAEETEQT